MDFHGRRRRGRGHSRSNVFPNQYVLPRDAKPWSLLSSLYSFIIMSSLIALIYMMLEHHCDTCSNKYGLHNITKSIEDIERNLSRMKESYNNLEIKVFQFSQEIPKIEGQIEILEVLANRIERKDGYNPRTQLALPNVDVNLTPIPIPDTAPKSEPLNNISVKSSKRLPLNFVEVD